MTRLDAIFNRCRKVPPIVERILKDRSTHSSEYCCIYTKKENIDNMIELFNVTSAHYDTTKRTFQMLTTMTIEKACFEWKSVINSQRSLKEVLLRQARLDKREELANKETKDDDDIYEHNYSPDDSPPYTPCVETHSSKLQGSNKTFTRSISSLNRKRKNRDRYKINPLNATDSERINIPRCNFIGPHQYEEAKLLLDFVPISSMSQENTDVYPSNGFTQMLDETLENCNIVLDKETIHNKKSILITPAKSNNLISVGHNVPLTQPCALATDKTHENEMNDNVEKILSLQSNNGNNNVEMVSKAMTDSNYIIANNEINKGNDMEIDTGLIVNSNNNIVESSDVKDRSKICSKENIKDNDVVVKDKDDNDMDTSLISKPPGEEVILHNVPNIIPMNNLVHGRFPTYFQPLIQLKLNDIVTGKIPFLITTPYIHHPENDLSEHISISKSDMENFGNDVYLGDGVVDCFLRWMSLQSNKISIIDPSSMLMKKSIDKKSNKVKETISTKHLILIPICQNNHWIIYFIIRSSENSFRLILMDSLFTVKRTHFTNTIFKWFESSKDAKQKEYYFILGNYRSTCFSSSK